MDRSAGSKARECGERGTNSAFRTRADAERETFEEGSTEDGLGDQRDDPRENGGSFVPSNSVGARWQARRQSVM